MRKGPPRTIHVAPGDRFGKLTVLEEAPNKKYPSGQVRRMVTVECDCGTVQVSDLFHVVGGAIVRCMKCRNDAIAARYAVNVNGYAVPLSRLLKRNGITQDAFSQRVHRGWTRERAATTPMQRRNAQ